MVSLFVSLSRDTHASTLVKFSERSAREGIRVWVRDKVQEILVCPRKIFGCAVFVFSVVS